jgi:Ras-related protein Rab-8A
MKQIESHASDNVVKVIVGNKSDLPNRVISTEKGEELANSFGLDFFETSAKTGNNISDLFMHVAKEIIKKRPAESASK